MWNDRNVYTDVHDEMDMFEHVSGRKKVVVVQHVEKPTCNPVISCWNSFARKAALVKQRIQRMQQQQHQHQKSSPALSRSLHMSTINNKVICRVCLFCASAFIIYSAAYLRQRHKEHSAHTTDTLCMINVPSVSVCAHKHTHSTAVMRENRAYTIIHQERPRKRPPFRRPCHPQSVLSILRRAEISQQTIALHRRRRKTATRHAPQKRRRTAKHERFQIEI